MANFEQEHRSSLRREAKRLLGDATSTSDISMRRALLHRSYALIQQAEICRPEASFSQPAATDPRANGKKGTLPEEAAILRARVRRASPRPAA